MTTLTGEIGSLLDHFVTKLAEKARVHRDTVAGYIVQGKMGRPQVDAALKFLTKLGDSELVTATFEKDCGVGVVVTTEQIAARVEEICAQFDEDLQKKGWNFQGQIIGKAKIDDLLRWVNGY